MATDFYPGSKRQRKDYGNLPEESEDKTIDWWETIGKGKFYLVNGQPLELFPIGAIAQALNRKPVTVRKWESEGVIPNSPYTKPSHDSRGQRRLYSREQIETLRKIADEEGVLHPTAGGKWKAIETTQFKDRALKAFRGG